MTNRPERWALVSGAASGIGRGVALSLARQGYRLWLIDMNDEGLRNLQRELSDPVIRIADLSNSAQLESICDDIETFDAGLELAFLNAGIVTPGNVIGLDRHALIRDVDINLRSAMWMNQACARKMKKQGRGHIINTVSMAAFVSLKGSAAYSASKFGLRGFLIAMRSEMRAYGVHVSMLLPSAIDTPMLRFEAESGGSALNFLSKPSSVERVVDAFERAQKSKKLEYYVPYFDAWLGRISCLFPRLLDLLAPLLEPLGERGRRRYLSKHQ